MTAAIPDLLWWGLVIFAAGIVGQFGKSLTLKILERYSQKKEPTGGEVAVEGEVVAEDAKDLKKRAKQEKKQRKKEAKSLKKAE